MKIKKLLSCFRAQRLSDVDFQLSQFQVVGNVTCKEYQSLNWRDDLLHQLWRITKIGNNSVSMIRRSIINLSKLVKTNYQAAQCLRSLSSQATGTDEAPKEDHTAARRWLSRFNINTVPRNLCEITFSRSSGPGGQNVNK